MNKSEIRKEVSLLRNNFDESSFEKMNQGIFERITSDNNSN